MKFLLKSKILSVQSRAQSGDTLAYSGVAAFQRLEYSSRRPCCCSHATTPLCFFRARGITVLSSHSGMDWRNRGLLSVCVPASSTPGSATLVLAPRLPPPSLDYPPSYLSYRSYARRGRELSRRGVPRRTALRILSRKRRWRLCASPFAMRDRQGRPHLYFLVFAE